MLSLPAATSTHFRSPMLFHNLRTTALLDARNCTQFTRAPIWCFRSTFARGQYRMLLALDYFTMFQQKSQTCVFTLGSLVITALFTSSDLWEINFQKYASMPEEDGWHHGTRLRRGADTFQNCNPSLLSVDSPLKLRKYCTKSLNYIIHRQNCTDL